MVSAKDLRDVFEDIRSEAGKRASDFVSDTKKQDFRMPEIGHRDQTPGIVWLGLGLVLGAVIGMAIALISAPYPGQETRRRLGQQVDKMKRQGEEQIEQIRPSSSSSSSKSVNGGTPAYTTPTAAYERS
ncbi:MAG TPA: YtxH domain-containing protein [Candidatus Limnocylindria bacterium]|nr:YtxH domain-containing protein [Candidatus Limnocylindria bacterium]